MYGTVIEHVRDKNGGLIFLCEPADTKTNISTKIVTGQNLNKAQSSGL